jgi:tetratricopeptide (TPR) repeat protein
MMRAAGRPVAGANRKLRSTAVAVLFCTLLCVCSGADAQSRSPSLSQIETLAAAQQWPEIVRLLTPVSPRSAEMDFYLGLALAHTGRSEEAVRVFDAGRRLAPRDARFPEELAGIAFQQKQYARAARLLRGAVKLAPQDEYANNFLATVYFLQDNIEAALQCWNRAGKPYVEQVSYQPQPRVSPALLDHAFAFSPAATLELPQFYATNARVRGLGIFPQYHFDLNALPGGHFNVVFRGSELDGFGDGWLAALMVLRGLPFQQVNPAFYNIRRRAINFDSMFRWDAQKRRLRSRLSGPLENGAAYRWNFAADLRNENWAVRNSFTGVAPVLAGLNMRREAGSLDVESYASGQWGWRAGAELSHRDFRSVSAGAVLTPRMLASGYELKQTAEASAALWRVPGHRFVLSGGAESQAARLWSSPRESFEKLTGALAWRWLPQAQGDDYETTQRFRAGTTFGQVPFDELFILGLDQDNNLPMRAHIATRGGRKGSAPMGRDYFLQNWETDKNIYGNGIVRVQLGPFIDIGRIWDPGASLGSHQWLFDTGVELRVRVLGTGVAFSYGRDLRTGNNAYYAVPIGSRDSTGFEP